MNALRKSLLTITAVFTLAPAAALALPPPCDDVCFNTANCDQVCSIGFRVYTCRSADMCFAPAAPSSDTTASVTETKDQRTGDAALVCSEEHPAEAQLETVES